MDRRWSFLVLGVVALIGAWWMLSVESEPAVPLDELGAASSGEIRPTLHADGQSGGAPADAEEERSAVPDFTLVEGPDIELMGRVLLGGRPVEGAEVRLRTAHRERLAWLPSSWSRPIADSGPPAGALGVARCDGEGRFRLSFARRSRCEIAVQHATGSMAPRLLVLPTRGQPGPLELHLDVASPLDVVVLDHQAQPRGACAVGAVQGTTRVHTEPMTRTETNARGEASLGPLAPGLASLHVGPVGSTLHVFRRRVPVEGRVPLRVDGRGEVRGTIRDAGGKPVIGARVILGGWTQQEFAFLGEGETSADGTYRIDGLPRAVVKTLEIHVPGSFPFRAGPEGPLDFQPELPSLEKAAQSVLDITLPVRESLRGRLVPPEGLTPAGGWVQVANPLRPGLALSVQADEQGVFALAGLPPASTGLRLYARTPEGLKGGLPAVWGGPDLSMWLARQEGPRETLTLEVPLQSVCAVEGWIEGMRGPPVPVVQIEGKRPYVALVGLDGRFRAVVPATGEPATAVLHPRQAAKRAHSAPFRLTAGASHEVTLSEAPGVSVRGRVTDEAGSPVHGATLFYVPPMGPPLDRHWGHGESLVLGRTNAQGVFEISLEAMQVAVREKHFYRWGLAARHPEYVSSSSRTIDPDRDETAPENTLVLRKGETLQGRVVDPDGVGAAGVEVRLTQDHARATISGPDGAFGFGSVDNDAYSLLATQGTLKAELRVTKEALAETGLASVELRLAEATVLAGRVLDPWGAPLSGVYVRAYNMVDGKSPFEKEPDASDQEWMAKIPEGLHEHVRRKRRMWGLHRSAGESPQVGPSGRFRIEVAEPGAYVVMVMPGWRASQGFLHTVTAPLTAPSHDIEVTVDGGASVTGRVLGPQGRPVVGAWVIGAWAEPDGVGGVMSHHYERPDTRTDGAGRFRLAGLPSDRFSLVVATHAFAVHEEVDVRPGDEVTMRLEVGETASIRILDASGAGLAGLRLKASPVLAPGDKPALFGPEARRTLKARIGSATISTPFDARFSATTDAEGRATFLGLAAGRYHIKQDRSMIRPGQPILPPMELVAGGTEPTFRARESLSIAGRVVDEAGQPIEYSFDFRATTTPSVDVRQEGHKGSTWRGSTSWDLADADTGAFEVAGLLPGPVKVTVTAGDNYKPHTFETEAGTRDIEIVLVNVERKDEDD